MADQFLVGSRYYLSGGTLDGKTITVSKFSGLKMDVKVSPISVGQNSSGLTILEPRPSSTKPGEPTFICAVVQGDKTLADWWTKTNPNTKSGQYVTQDLLFTLETGGKPAATWALRGVFPKSYELSQVSAGSSELATETIVLAVTEILRLP